MLSPSTKDLAINSNQNQDHGHAKDATHRTQPTRSIACAAKHQKMTRCRRKKRRIYLAHQMVSFDFSRVFFSKIICKWIYLIKIVNFACDSRCTKIQFWKSGCHSKHSCFNDECDNNFVWIASIQLLIRFTKHIDYTGV